MITSFTIKNFRCFRELTVKPLERVNLIAGKNNAGKTSLLEAVFLHSGPHNPQLPSILNAFRGIDRINLDAEGIWGWLFFGKRLDESIELISRNERQGTRSLRLKLVEPKTTQLVPVGNSGSTRSNKVESLTTATDLRDLLLEYQYDAQTVTSRATITKEGRIEFEHASLAPLPQTIFCFTIARFGPDDIERFSKLEEVGRQNEILPILDVLDRRVRRLAVLVTAGMPMIHADIGSGRLVPLPLMGEGMVRLTAILLAIANARDGTVLVDEIENGLHYSVMQKVWQAIGEAARRNNVQVFATTHSWECIRAAHEAFSASETYDFRLHRLDLIDDGISAVSYSQKMLETALTTGLEVR